MCCFSNFRSLVVSERLFAPTLDSDPSDVPPPESEVALEETEGEGGGVGAGHGPLWAGRLHLGHFWPSDPTLRLEVSRPPFKARSQVDSLYWCVSLPNITLWK